MRRYVVALAVLAVLAGGPATKALPVFERAIAAASRMDELIVRMDEREQTMIAIEDR